jgi:hypothetical protein
MKKRSKPSHAKSHKKRDLKLIKSPTFSSNGDIQERYKSLLVYGYGGLGCFVLAMWMAHSASTSSIPNALERLYQTHCQQPTHYCSHDIQVEGRDLKARAPIRPKTKLLTIPRETQIWDIDALRSPLIQEFNLLEARHAFSNRPLHNSAYLAAYLALRQQDDDPYLQYLPKHSDYTSFHPISMDSHYLQQQLGGEHSYALTLVSFFKDKIQSEYQAFSNISPEFANIVTRTQYKESRIHVLSRSFQHGKTNIQLTKEEQVLFQHLDTTNSLAMVPLLDALDHRIPENNMGWFPSKQNHDITMYSTQTLEPGAILYNAYGSSDTQEYMFAVYGFCLGTESLSRSFTAYHQTIEGVHLPPGGLPLEEWQRTQLIRYLAHDDGYRDCIAPTPNTTVEYALKLLKLQVLERIANAPRYWVVTLPGRRKEPFDSPQITEEHLESVLQTCRLLALTYRDYHGMAGPKLRQILQKRQQPLLLERGSDALEYRAWTWLYRLARMERNKYNVSMEDQYQRVYALKASSSSEWTLAQVQLGELLTLETVMSYAKEAIQKLGVALDDGEDFVIREKACPLANVEPLIQH